MAISDARVCDGRTKTQIPTNLWQLGLGEWQGWDEVKEAHPGCSFIGQGRGRIGEKPLESVSAPWRKWSPTALGDDRVRFGCGEIRG